MPTGFYFDEKCLWHAGALYAGFFPVGGWVQPLNTMGHFESPDSKRRLKSLADVSGLLAALDQRTAPLATEADLLRVHPQHYLTAFKTLSDAGGGDMGEGASFGPGGFEIAKQSAGLAIAGIDAVIRGELKNAYILSRPPGHHCRADFGMGFCMLANTAIAVEAAIAKHGLTRIAVLDWDVHHGNGTESIFLDRPDVLTISLHQENCYPINSGSADERGQGKGLGYNLNIPLLPGGGDQAYRDAFELLVLPTLEAYEPQLIIVACGLDANCVDPLARMMLHSESFRWMMAEVMAVADRLCAGKVAVVHEGGYAESYVPFCGHAVIEQLSGHKTAVIDPELTIFTAQQPKAAFQSFQRQILEAQAQHVFAK